MICITFSDIPPVSFDLGRVLTFEFGSDYEEIAPQVASVSGSQVLWSSNWEDELRSLREILSRQMNAAPSRSPIPPDDLLIGTASIVDAADGVWRSSYANHHTPEARVQGSRLLC